PFLPGLCMRSLCFYSLRHPPISSFFPYTTLFRSNTFIYSVKQLPIIKNLLKNTLYSNKPLKVLGLIFSIILELIDTFLGKFLYVDRKSTRLNSSHVSSSYAVFCLKKKEEQDVSAA